MWELIDGLSWQAAAIAVLLAFVVLLTVGRGRSPAMGALLRVAAAAAAVVATFAVFNTLNNLQNAAAQRAWDARATEVGARALVPGSPLACLDGHAGEVIENACEKAVFARPETTAVGVAYIEAKLKLLSDGLKLGARDAGTATAVAGLRRAIELDRFGLAAQVLAIRDGCTAERCAAFALLNDPATLKANLKARAYDTYVARYAPDWGKEPAVAETPKPAEEPAQASAAGAPAPVSERYDFPSSASIPPVSIMNSEPPRPPEGDAAAHAPAAAESPLRLPPRRPQTQGAATR
jgi:hypothetical protein